MKKAKLSGIEIFVIVAIIITTLLVLVSAGEAINNSMNAISEGTVIDKYPERTEKGGIIWTLRIEGYKGDKKVEYYFPVPESEYTSYKVGDHYPKIDYNG